MYEHGARNVLYVGGDGGGRDVASVSPQRGYDAGRCKRRCTLRREAAATLTPPAPQPPHTPPAHAILTNR